MAAVPECLELPRPARLLRTAGWNLFESFGLPLGGYALAAWLWGRNAGVLAMLGAIWVTAGIRKLVTGSIPSLLTIALIVLTVQGVVAVATGNLWIFLVHFPLANLGLCILFGYSARGHSPLAERLAGEVIGLRCPECYQASLRPFFRRVTWLWAGIFLALAVSLGALLATVPIDTYVLIWAVTTVAAIAAGVGASVLMLRSVLRRLGIGFRFDRR
ncbi:MAG: hypothetical protein ABSA02_00760 [Trebonia sp.]